MGRNKYYQWVALLVMTCFLASVQAYADTIYRDDIALSDPSLPPSLELSVPKKTSAEEMAFTQEVQVSLCSEMLSIQPGKTLWLLLSFELAPGWHLYWNNPGDAGLAPHIQWHLPEKLKVADPVWPSPSWIERGSAISFGYEGSLGLLIPLFAEDGLELGKKVNIAADISWIACKESCVPGQAHFSFTLPVVDQTPEKDVRYEDLFAMAREIVPEKGVVSIAQKNATGITLSIHLEPVEQEIQSVYFFPEAQNVFTYDSLKKWKLNAHNELQIELSQIVNSPLPQTIQGVLVVHYQEPRGSARSWSIDVPIKPLRHVQEEPMGGHSAEKIEDSLNVQHMKNRMNPAIALSGWEGFYAAAQSIFSSDFSYILVLAFLGGMILNVMPCVLPVVGLKVLNFIQIAGHSRFKSFKHSLVYTLGILFSFWALALALYALKTSGYSVGWGFQLQEPLFVTVLILVLFSFSLSLFGVFDFGASIASYAANLNKTQTVLISGREGHSPGYMGSFFSGVLATLVATPCTGPLLGSALGFAVSIEPMQAFVLFTCIGVGLSFPYVLLSLFPFLTRLLPKPGAWMNSFKELMGFFMIGTVLWLFWVLGAETEQLNEVSLLASLFLLAIALWIYGKWAHLGRKKEVRVLALIACFSLILYSSYGAINEVRSAQQRVHAVKKMNLAESSEDIYSGWIEYSEEKLQSLKEQHIPVFINFTAKWCLICQSNHFVLESARVQQTFKDLKIVRMQADWTRGDPKITQALHRLGRNGVPVYALYVNAKSDDIPPLIFPEALTPDALIHQLKQSVQGSKVHASESR